MVPEKHVSGLASEPSFEEAIGRLERLVEQLESGELSLDEALCCFEEGIDLVRICHQRLQAAEGKVEVLLQTLNKGNLKVVGSLTEGAEE